MNIFDYYLEKIKILLNELNKEGQIILPSSLESINAEIPPEKFNCDISTNVAMVLSKINSKSPFDFANILSEKIKSLDEYIEDVSVAKPGFINIKLKPSFWTNFISSIIKIPDTYGVNEKEKKNKYLVEFVSANPTGPLHVGHCRGAILGDVISNILSFNNHDVTKEYYVNDYGNQIINFTKSVYSRIREIKFNEPFPVNNEDLYPGDYLIDFANNIINSNNDLNFENYEKISAELTKLSIAEAMNLIKRNLNSLGIEHDNFVSEKSIVEAKEVEKVIDFLTKNNHVYKGKIKAPKGEDDPNWVEREQLLFKSTDFGDDKDRALQKSDGSWTYFASDVAYHKNKLDRKFDKLINILGADHAGYLKRLQACVTALSDSKVNFVCKVCQLVKLYKSGEPYKMSKRAGDFITAKELVDAVGKDAVRFMMIYRSNDSQLDFDFDLVTEKSKENPVFYVQYATARINSILRKVKVDNNQITKDDLSLLNSSYELEIIKKLSVWPKCLELSAVNLEPHRIPYYLYELSSMFHSYWNLGKENNDFKIVDNPNINLVKARVFLINKILLILKSGLLILNVSAPETM